MDHAFFGGAGGSRRAGPSALLTVALLVAAGGLGELGCRAERGGSGTSQRPNVVVIVVDTLRADHLDLYGYEIETAPFLAKLGAESAVFTSAFSSSTWTAPSTATFFTGLYPQRHGVLLGFFANLQRAREVEARGETTMPLGRLPSSVTTLPEHFREQGYRTYGIATNINIGPEMGFDRGFDEFLRLANRSAAAVRETLAEWQADIESHQPYFLYLHLDDVHRPYDPRAPWYRESGDERMDTAAAYDSEIRYVDGVLEEIAERFAFGPAVGTDRGADRSSTVLMVLSDHGEEFWDHGETGHGFSLHYEVNRIAMVVHAPGVGVVPGVRVENVGGVDVLPTLLDLVGAPLPPDTDGRSLAPLLRQDVLEEPLRRELAERPIFGHRADRRSDDVHLWSVVRGPWKLIEKPGGHQLFDLSRDTGETHDVGAAHPERVAELRAALRAFRTLEPVESSVAVDVTLDGGDLESLRALGYVEDEHEPH